MRASRWAAFGAWATLVACGGAIAPVGGDKDGGGGAEASSRSSGSSGSSGSSSGFTGSSASGSSSGFTGSSASGSSSGFTGSSSGGITCIPSGNNCTANPVACCPGTSCQPTGTCGAVTDAAFGCSGGVQPPTTGSAACDQCIDSSCGMSLCTCTADSPVDDLGNVAGCLGFVNCIVGCLAGNPDAGIRLSDGGVTQCATECAPAYSMQQQQEGANLLGCIAISCVATPNSACASAFAFQ